MDLEDAEVVIGRDPTCDICIHGDDVSWRHAAIRRVDGFHVLVDLGSTNGTSVNGVPVTDPVQLSPGDSVEVAGVHSPPRSIRIPLR
ncbi:MAG: FHA domain-containing protein [Deltaproteobacteria bacterium]|nr:FHA domain-containing protein [Deltaproteobacteria bacterium]